jgi:hypothetical protein
MTTVPEVPWESFIKRWPTQYRQDQHVTIIGPTDCGKTILAQQLIACRGLVVGTGVKYADESLERLLKQGWHRIDRWDRRPRTAERVLLWPKIDNPEEAATVHKERFTQMLAKIYKSGKWCIWTDELRYLTDTCGMARVYRSMYVTARSNKISLVSAAQRPAWVPLEAYSQAQHLFIHRTGFEDDLKKMLGGHAKNLIETVNQLPWYHFLYVNLRTGDQAITMATL